MRPLSRLVRAPGTKGFTQPLSWLADAGASWSLSTGSREADSTRLTETVERVYKANGIVAACVAARAYPYSEARFQMQELVAGRPGHLFDHPSLKLLETPWPNGSTGEMLMRLEQDFSLAGNAYLTTVGVGADRRLRRLRPDWVTVVSGLPDGTDGSAWELDARVLGYIYHPKGVGAQYKPTVLSVDTVAHYSPLPDPVHQWRGMSWLTPVLNEIDADTEATKHKLSYFRRGTALQYALTYDPSLSPTAFAEYVELFNASHTGERNAYKTLHLGGGSDVKLIGSDLKSIDFKAVQGAGETRIAAAAGVGAIIGRFSEGMQGSSLNAGNYGAAKRQFADMTVRPLWRTTAATLAKLVDVPANARLWYDSRDIEFLKEDRKDAAEIMSLQASTMRTLVDAGYTPDSVRVAVETGDFTRLDHSGMYSVQLQSPGAGGDTPEAKARQVAEMVQKIYLGVGVVLSDAEARAIITSGGGNLPGALATTR